MAKSVISDIENVESDSIMLIRCNLESISDEFRQALQDLIVATSREVQRLKNDRQPISGEGV